MSNAREIVARVLAAEAGSAASTSGGRAGAGTSAGGSGSGSRSENAAGGVDVMDNALAAQWEAMAARKAAREATAAGESSDGGDDGAAVAMPPTPPLEMSEDGMGDGSGATMTEPTLAHRIKVVEAARRVEIAREETTLREAAAAPATKR